MSRGRGSSRLALALAIVAAGLLSVASTAQGYEVRITVKGGGSVTETTPANLVGSSCSLPSSAGNNLLKQCLAGTPSGDYGWGWDVDYLATPAAGYSFVGWESDGSSRQGVVCDRSTPPASTTTYSGTACKFKTYQDLQTRAVFRDTTPPTAPVVGGAPSGPVNGPVTFSLSTSSDPTFSHYTCALYGPAVSSTGSCSAPSVTYNPAGSGQYTLNVTAVDASGQVSSTVQRAFTVDKTPPETTIAPDTGPPPGAVVSSKTAAFSLTSSEAGTMRCTLDGAPRDCSAGSPLTLTGLTEGEHVLRAWAVDGLGNADTTPAERRWTVDTIAPDVTLDPSVGPAEGATVRSPDALFRYASSEPDATVHCALDGLELAACESPLVLSRLADGSHALKVWAVDAAGNTDASPAQRHWTVDAVTDPTPPGPGTPPPSEACAKAKKALAAAKAKLRRLKRSDARAAKVRKARKRVRKAKRAARSACATS